MDVSRANGIDVKAVAAFVASPTVMTIHKVEIAESEAASWVAVEMPLCESGTELEDVTQATS